MNALNQLLEYPVHARKEQVTEYLISVFRPYIQIDDSEDVPLEISLFDLGLNSLDSQSCRYEIESYLECKFDIAELYLSLIHI